jgi:hypothetical protein
LKKLLGTLLVLLALVLFLTGFTLADDNLSVDSPSDDYSATLALLGEDEDDGCSLTIVNTEEEIVSFSTWPQQCDYLVWATADSEEMVVTKSLDGQAGLTFPAGNPYSGDVHSIEFALAEMFFGYYLAMQCPHGQPDMIELSEGIDEEEYGACAFGNGPISIEHVWISEFDTVHAALNHLEEEPVVTEVRVDYYDGEDELYPMNEVLTISPSEVTITEFSPYEVVNLEYYGLVLIGTNQHNNVVGLNFAGEWIDLREVHP